eukprot:m.201208 g.201208  ORF g.201208 m.201208 type:complete len:194 (+) comp18798_c0_seq5:158-739(+)
MPAPRSSAGDAETDKLRQNLEEQLDRLVAQLGDLEELREELDDEEYEETREETLSQLKEFQESLKSVAGGNMSLVDSIGAMNLAIQAAVGGTFKSPEVIRMMGKRDPEALRKRLGELESQCSSGSITEAELHEQKAAILTAIRKIGGKISATEAEFIVSHGSAELEDFEKVSTTLAGVAALNLAGDAVSAAKQ